jgi:hypothetical protein
MELDGKRDIPAGGERRIPTPDPMARDYLLLALGGLGPAGVLVSRRTRFSMAHPSASRSRPPSSYQVTGIDPGRP